MNRGGQTPRADSETKADLRKVMRLFPQGVTVVTTQVKEGPRGLTVSSFISVSFDPPLVLVSLGKSSDLHASLIRARSFAVNILGSDQKSVSERFAGPSGSTERFEGVGFHSGVTGCPVIEGALAVIECNVWRVYEGGDHSLIIGEVVRALAARKEKPLVYRAQGYTTTAD